MSEPRGAICRSVPAAFGQVSAAERFYHLSEAAVAGERSAAPAFNLSHNGGVNWESEKSVTLRATGRNLKERTDALWASSQPAAMAGAASGHIFKSGGGGAEDLMGRSDSAALVAQLNRELASTVVTLQEERRGRANDAAEATRNLAKASHDGAAQADRIQRLEALNQKLTDEVQLLRAQREESAEALAASEKARKTESNAHEGRVSELKSKLATMTAEAQSQTYDTSRLREDSDAMRRAAVSAQSDVAAATRECQVARKQAADASAVAERSRAEADALRERLYTVEEERDRAKAAWEASQAHATRLMATVDQLEAQLSAAQAAAAAAASAPAAQMHTNTPSAAGSSAAGDAAAAGAGAREAAQRAEMSALSQDLESAKSHCAALGARLGVLRFELSAAEDRERAARDEAREAARQLEEERLSREALEERCRRLNADVANFSDANTASGALSPAGMSPMPVRTRERHFLSGRYEEGFLAPAAAAAAEAGSRGGGRASSFVNSREARGFGQKVHFAAAKMDMNGGVSASAAAAPRHAEEDMWDVSDAPRPGLLVNESDRRLDRFAAESERRSNFGSSAYVDAALGASSGDTRSVAKPTKGYSLSQSEGGFGSQKRPSTAATERMNGTAASRGARKYEDLQADDYDAVDEKEVDLSADAPLSRKYEEAKRLMARQSGRQAELQQYLDSLQLHYNSQPLPDANGVPTYAAEAAAAGAAARPAGRRATVACGSESIDATAAAAAHLSPTAADATDGALSSPELPPQPPPPPHTWETFGAGSSGAGSSSGGGSGRRTAATSLAGHRAYGNGDHLPRGHARALPPPPPPLEAAARPTAVDELLLNASESRLGAAAAQGFSVPKTLAGEADWSLLFGLPPPLRYHTRAAAASAEERAHHSWEQSAAALSALEHSRSNISRTCTSSAKRPRAAASAKLGASGRSQGRGSAPTGKRSGVALANRGQARAAYAHSDAATAGTSGSANRGRRASSAAAAAAAAAGQRKGGLGGGMSQSRGRRGLSVPGAAAPGPLRYSEIQSLAQSRSGGVHVAAPGPASARPKVQRERARAAAVVQRGGTQSGAFLLAQPTKASLARLASREDKGVDASVGSWRP